jgi:hypothetical protein
MLGAEQEEINVGILLLVEALMKQICNMPIGRLM